MRVPKTKNACFFFLFLVESYSEAKGASFPEKLRAGPGTGSAAPFRALERHWDQKVEEWVVFSLPWD